MRFKVKLERDYESLATSDLGETEDKMRAFRLKTIDWFSVCVTVKTTST